jgi:hypothetical protein
MNLIFDAISDFFPKRGIPKPPPKYKKELAELERVRQLIGAQGGETTMKTIKVTPPEPKAMVSQDKEPKKQEKPKDEPQIEPEEAQDGQAELPQAEISIEDVIVDTYRKVDRMERDINAIIGILLKKE